MEGKSHPYCSVLCECEINVHCRHLTPASQHNVGYDIEKAPVFTNHCTTERTTKAVNKRPIQEVATKKNGKSPHVCTYMYMYMYVHDMST